MESTSTSSTARRLAISVCLAFHRSRPANAAPLSGEFATVISGIFTRDFFVAVFFVADFARDGITRAASPSILRKCGGQGASAIPAASSLSARSSNFSSEPGDASISACGLPIFAKRSGP